MTLRIGFIGCVESSRAMLNVLVSMPEIKVCAVVTKGKSKSNSDFSDLSDICVAKSIPYHYEILQEKSASYNFLSNYNIDLIYCVGWSYLLDDQMLRLPKMGVIGFHPAALPKNRGRHPIIWTLCLGLDKTASTFFKMDSTADSGPIVSQKSIQIHRDDYAANLYDKIIEVAVKQIRELTLKFVINDVKLIKQDNALATYWRKRTASDGLIDWRMSAWSIYNLVRALAPPYPCAEFKVNDTYVKVPKCSMVVDKFPENIEPGFILQKGINSLLIKVAGSDAILIENIDYDFSHGRTYL